jgi:tetratricopeptide (TPR) repeat protein
VSAPLLLALALAAPSSNVSPAAELEAKQLAHTSQLEFDLGHFEEALRDVERAYVLDPLPGLLFNLGQCHRQLKHWEQAETAFRSFLRYQPNAPNRQVVLNLIKQMGRERSDATQLARRSQVDYDLGKFEEALEAIEHAYQLDPLPGFLFNLGQCHRKLGHWADAETAFHNYLLHQPNAPNRQTVLNLIQEMRYNARQEELAGARAPRPPVATAPAPPAAATPPPPVPAPPPAVEPAPPVPESVLAAEAPKPGSSHALAWTFVGVGAVAATLATIAAIEVGQYQSTSSGLAASEGSQAGLLTPSFGNLSSQESTALTWRTVGFVALGVACASVPAVFLTW